MSEVSRRQLFAGLVALPFAGLIASAETPAASTAHKFAPRLSGREMLRRRYFPNFELTTSDKKKVRFYDDLLKDKLVVINMMYADCKGVCPTITANLKRAQKLLKEQVTQPIFIYSITVKPEEDSPKKLKEYAKMHGIHDSNWLFMTGKPAELDMLRHALGFADPDPKIDKDKSRHSGMLRYGNEPMALWGTCQGNGEPAWIAQEVGFAIPRQFKRDPRVNE